MEPGVTNMSHYLTKNEARIAAFACAELFRRYAEFAATGKGDWAQSNEKAAKEYRSLADKLYAYADDKDALEIKDNT